MTSLHKFFLHLFLFIINFFIVPVRILTCYVFDIMQYSSNPQDIYSKEYYTNNTVILVKKSMAQQRIEPTMNCLTFTLNLFHTT